MSKFMMNKFIRSVEMSDDALAAYIADKPAYVRRWLGESAPSSRVTDDRVLTDAERRAFETFDYAALYALGAHPYLLWHWVEAVDNRRHTFPDLNRIYKEAIAGHGYPSFLE